MKDGNALFRQRHSLAHILAMAILEKYPAAHITIGPVTDNGFYYDIDFGSEKTPDAEELTSIEARMRQIVQSKLDFTVQEMSVAEAKKLFAQNPYKMELIEGIEATGQQITTYTTGTFVDLCEGPHVSNTSEIAVDGFKLSHLAGAYWRGDEKNKMLTRVYGLAFESKADLDAYIFQMEEAKKRDHRTLGKQLGLFVFSDLVGPGLPLWTPKGTLMRELLNDYVWSLRKKKGYQKVTIPHITKKSLYETSGHWAKYADDLFKIGSRDGREYAMKPMNCPHHTQIFDAEQRSYRDMPQRYCETTMVYRDEQSGELAGLTRVLSITQDDAHVFCRENQIEAEVNTVWEIIETFYKTFNFTLTPRFSRHDPSEKEKYMGGDDTWAKAEGAIKSLMEKRGAEYIDGLGEAAFYGPKIDFMAFDAIGRRHQVATIQLDFVQPENFGLYCINEEGKKERVVMIHCAVMGSIERFSATYLEHCAGNLPLWLSPVQVRILPIADAHKSKADELLGMLSDAGIRTEIDDSNIGFGKRVRKAKEDKLPYFIVIGDKDIEAGTVTLESRDAGNLGGYTFQSLLEKLAIENESKQ
jgi:threonyl-tRNA synthetase